MKKTKVLLLHKGTKCDYQNDMVFISLLTNQNIIFDSNIYPDFLFKDFKGSNLYGRGFTMYKKLDISYKKNDLDNLIIKKRIESTYYDLIIYSSIRRYDKFFNQVIKFYSRDKIICIDGEDDLTFSVKHYLNACYFKREMSKFLAKINIEPISFFIPNLVLEELKKNYNFNLKKKFMKAYCDPNDKKTYIFKDEKNYYKQYSNSLFGVTKMKRGWDCLRHYEIILCNCLPYFENFDRKPPLVMQGYPEKYQLNANNLFKLQADKKVCDFDIKKYKYLISKFQKYQEEMSYSFGSIKLKNMILDKKRVKKSLISRNKNIFWILFLRIVNIFLVFKWIFMISREKKKPSRIIIFIYNFLIKNTFKKLLN